MIVKNFFKTAVLGIAICAILGINNSIASPDMIIQIKEKLNNELTQSLHKIEEFENSSYNSKFAELNNEANKKVNTILSVLNQAGSGNISFIDYELILNKFDYFMELNDNYYISHFNCQNPFFNVIQYIIHNENNIKEMVKELKQKIDYNIQ